MASKRKIREKRQFWTVVITTIMMAAVPPVLAICILLPLKRDPKPRYGILRPEPGQAAIIEETAASDPSTESLKAVETLNARMTEIILETPSEALVLPSKKNDEVEAILTKNLLGEEHENLLTAYAKARKAGAFWNQSALPWGAFQLPKDRAPRRGFPYGIIQTQWGAEKSRRKTETTLNRIIFQVGHPPSGTLLETLQKGVEKGLLKPAEARETLGLAQLLNIQYIPSKGLFLSTKTLEKWDAVLETISKLPPTPFP